MTDLKARRAKIAARSPDRRARVTPPVDGRSSGGGPAGRGDDFWADLEELLGGPAIVIDAVDLCNGDYGKACRPRRLPAGAASPRAFKRH